MARTLKFSDTFLKALWVYSYAGLVRVFSVLKRMEASKEGLRKPISQGNEHRARQR